MLLSSKVHAEGVAALDELRNDDAFACSLLPVPAKSRLLPEPTSPNLKAKLRSLSAMLFTKRSFFNSIDTFPKPVIAMVNGFCLGGGNELALACDLRIASENARFSQPEINLGIMCGGGGTQRLPRLVGEGRAMEMILTGDMIDAATAHKFGLVNHVYPLAEFEAKTLKWRKDRRKSSDRFAAMKRSREICLAFKSGRRLAARG